MRTEALNHKFVYGTPIQGGRLALDLADMHQKCTQTYVRRPYGVGLLIGVCDQTGPHLYVTDPSGNYYEYFAMAIGSRSQTSRTYLENQYENFPNCTKDELIRHGLKALAVSLAGDAELKSTDAVVVVVSPNRDLEFIEGSDLQRHLDAIEVEGVPTMDVEEPLTMPDL